MKAVVFRGVGDIRLEDVPEPKLSAPTDAIVRLTASAICGTDLHMIRGSMPGMKSLTFHPWLSRVAEVDCPDFVLFDLDPGAAPFSRVVEVARLVRRELEHGERCEPFLKTSGKSGLHVLVRWVGEGGYDQARAWATEIAHRVVRASEGLATVERSIRKRGERVYVDVMQNARGRHAVPPYVLRPTPCATVSTPLDWKELTAKLDPQRFTLKTIFRRVERPAGDPMVGLLRPRAPRTAA